MYDSRTSDLTVCAGGPSRPGAVRVTLPSMDIFAPFAGHVRFEASDGQTVTTGDRLAVVEAVKVEAVVAAPGPGVVQRGSVEDFSRVDGGDLILRLTALPEPGQ